MKNLLKGKRVYIDTNIFIYVATKHSQYFEPAYRVLEMLVAREFYGFGSHLVIFELFGALSRIDPAVAYEAVVSYLELPIAILEIDREALRYAKEIARLSRTTYDALHAAIAARNGIDIVVTEDLEDWSRIVKAWKEVKKVLPVKDLTVFSPSRGIIR